jgi:hypothetical protein
MMPADKMDWSELPDIYEVRNALQELVIARANLRALELELTIVQADISVRVPRNTAARVVGIDEESRDTLIRLQRAIVEAKNSLDHWESEVKFCEFRKEAAKVVGYKSRI